MPEHGLQLPSSTAHQPYQAGHTSEDEDSGATLMMCWHHCDMFRHGFSACLCQVFRSRVAKFCYGHHVCAVLATLL